MKRSRIASVVLAIAVVMSMTFTSGIGAFAGTVTNGTSAAGTIAAQDMNSTDDSSYISYTAKAIKNSSAVVPVTVKSAGTIIVPLQGIAVGKNLTVSMHTDTAATDANKIGYAKYLSSSTVNDVLTADVAKDVNFTTGARKASFPVLDGNLKSSQLIFRLNLHRQRAY